MQLESRINRAGRVPTLTRLEAPVALLHSLNKSCGQAQGPDRSSRDSARPLPFDRPCCRLETRCKPHDLGDSVPLKTIQPEGWCCRSPPSRRHLPSDRKWIRGHCRIQMSDKKPKVQKNSKSPVAVHRLVSRMIAAAAPATLASRDMLPDNAPQIARRPRRHVLLLPPSMSPSPRMS